MFEQPDHGCLACSGLRQVVNSADTISHVAEINKYFLKKPETVFVIRAHGRGGGEGTWSAQPARSTLQPCFDQPNRPSYMPLAMFASMVMF
jgi:hypothetical protein